MKIVNFNNQKNGYSADKYNELFKGKQPYALIGSGLQPVLKWENNKPTAEIIAQHLDIYFPDLGVQRVKFPKDFSADKIKDLSEVSLVKPEACVVGNNVYVRAEGLE